MEFQKKFIGLRSFVVTFFVLMSTSLSMAGGSNIGGGDQYVADFVKVATKEVYPWLKLIGPQLKPKVSAEMFYEAIDPRQIISVPEVYESCQFLNGDAVARSSKDRRVEACYDGKFIYISRSLYPLQVKKNPAKQRLVAHEIFRKMHLEGDQYEITKQLDVLSVSVKANCTVCGETGVNPRSLCTDAQETTLALDATQSFRTLHFGRFNVEVWGVAKENPRIFVFDSKTSMGASGQIDLVSGSGLVQLIMLRGERDVLAHVSCDLKAIE